MNYRLGVDIGGTFTDAILIHEETGTTAISKVSSTPTDPATGFINAVERVLEENKVAAGDISYLVHGTTVATNAIIEGNLSPTAFVTTDGFRDMMEIQRQTRPSLYDLQFDKPKPLVPRQHCFGIEERLDATGEILIPLAETSILKLAQQLQQADVEAVAICLLHAYKNPDHEQQLAGRLIELLPALSISYSADIAPEFREYFRACTTVINAGIQPVVSRYLANIETKLRLRGVDAELLIMQSSGGVYSFSEAQRKPVFMVESGPAAGVISAAYLGSIVGHQEIISFDMGGTTAKVGLIQEGVPRTNKEYEVGLQVQAGTGSSRGSGYPLRTPVIDLVEIGAGGGSIAWIDSGGSLRVGPRSAGADPGPVCYGRGGMRPTVTDANLVLGRLSPAHFLGGEMHLDVKVAREAIRTHCAEPLGLPVVETAYGIVEIANNAMVNALRLISVQRGYDPREFMLVGFGGAGPLHANRLAEAMEMPTILVPRSPGTTSALGLLVTDLKHEFARNIVQPFDQLDLASIEQLFSTLAAQGKLALEQDGISEKDIIYERHFDMRYIGQSHELSIPVSDHNIAETTIIAVQKAFHAAHERSYGFSAPDEPLELVTVKIIAIGTIVKPPLQLLGETDGEAEIMQTEIYFGGEKGFVTSPILDRYRLSPGQRISGPAMFVEYDSTIILQPDYVAQVDPFGNLLIQAQE